MRSTECDSSYERALVFCAAEPAQVEQGPEPVLKVAVGRVAVLTCRVFGAPRPTVIWQKGELVEDVEDFHDPRITVLDKGDLKIQVSLIACILAALRKQQTVSCLLFIWINLGKLGYGV